LALIGHSACPHCFKCIVRLIRVVHAVCCIYVEDDLVARNALQQGCVWMHIQVFNWRPNFGHDNTNLGQFLAESKARKSVAKIWHDHVALLAANQTPKLKPSFGFSPALASNLILAWLLPLIWKRLRHMWCSRRTWSSS
jgi:hypothetical protein